MERSDASRIAEEVIDQCSADMRVREVKPLVQALLRESNLEEDTLISKLALQIDIEEGALQKEYEQYVLDQGGFTVEEDGVVYGFDKDGNHI